MNKIVKKIKVSMTVKCLTGLHVGGSKDSVEIGGIDTPVIKVATKGSQPYIPGSSLKGKMRCLLEQVAGVTKVGGDLDVNKLFGCIGNDGNPSRLIVRDAYLTEKSLEEFKKCPDLDMPFTENKYENTISRTQGKAEHPRQIERVPAGAEFAVEMIINVWEDDQEGEELKALLEKGINLLENDYLGGNGSRGYGQVVFSKPVYVELSEDNNWKA